MKRQIQNRHVRFGLTCLFAVVVLLNGRVSSCCFGQDIPTGVLGEGKPWQTPFYVNDSGVEGPTVVVTGGIHGNEPAGSRAADQIRYWPIVRGKLIVVPRVNTFGLKENIRHISRAPGKLRDLNRNFPSPGIAETPRGEIATALWKFVVEQNPDWLFDLHEGYQFNISHKPKSGKDKSVGSSIIYKQEQGFGPMVERMHAAANGMVENPKRKFVLLKRGPKKTTLSRATIDVLGKRSMILETTFNYQRLSFRVRQHRAMMNVALRQIGVIKADLSEVMTPPKDQRGSRIFVALYDDDGGSENGVQNLTRVFDASPNISVAHLNSSDIRPDVLSQFDTVVFGGGSGSKQAKTIGKEASKAVRGFVQDGGGYVGICAGAYLCSAHYSWSLKLVDTHVFTGSREVAGLGSKPMYYRGDTTTVKMQLTEQGRELFADVPTSCVVSYHNGPIVSKKNAPGLPAFTPLAFYRSEQTLYPPQKGTMIDTPAIVHGEFGKGQVISISPHPEATKGLENMVATAAIAVGK